VTAMPLPPVALISQMIGARRPSCSDLFGGVYLRGDLFLAFGLVVLSAGLTVALFATETKAGVLEEISP
jgi:hypothetical protein